METRVSALIKVTEEKMALTGFLLGLLQAEINPRNFAALASFLGDRLGGKPIELKFEANGKKLEVKANSQAELVAAIQYAQELLGASKEEFQSEIAPQLAQGKQQLGNQLVVQLFLEQTGAEVIPNNWGLQIVTVPESLRLKPPISVLVATDKITDQEVAEFVGKSKRLGKAHSGQAGILIYREPPDTLVRIQIAKARLKDSFMLIPIPLAEVEDALPDVDACKGILTDYANRYVHHADFFDDRNAISDTLSFFGRVDLLEQLKERLLRSQGVGLFGLRKSGKTSVLYQLRFLLREYPVVHIDLQRHSRTRFGANLFNDILHQLFTLAIASAAQNIPSFDNFASNTPASELVDEFIQRVRDLAKALKTGGYKLPIFCFLDEVERILPTSKQSQEKVEEFNACLGALRVLSQGEPRVSLLVADVHPDCNRINHWSQEGVPTNPVFKFFSEIFLSPFSEQETTEMLTDLGKLMGIDFDTETSKEIHRASGGHPYVARQIARFLSTNLSGEGNRVIEWLLAQNELDNSLLYSDEINNYFEKSIWEDLEKRNFESAMSILRILAAQKDLDEWIAGQALVARLGASFSQAQCRQALNWLVAVGLLERKQTADGDHYQIHTLHFSRWLQMQMSEKEIHQWQAL